MRRSKHTRLRIRFSAVCWDDSLCVSTRERNQFPSVLPSTTRTSLRVFRINGLQATAVAATANCDRPLDLSLSLMAIWPSLTTNRRSQLSSIERQRHDGSADPRDRICDVRRGGVTSHVTSNSTPVLRARNKPPEPDSGRRSSVNGIWPRRCFPDRL